MDDHALAVLEYDALKQVLASYATSDLARSVVLALRPSSDRSRVELSLAQLAEARRLSDLGRPLPLAGLIDIVALVRAARAASRSLEPLELLALRDVLAMAQSTRALLAAEPTCPRLAELGRRILDHASLLTEIEATVESPGSVRDGASPRLERVRVERRALEEEIRSIVTQMAQSPRLKGFLQERGFSLRNGRYVLLVKADKKGHVPGILHDLSGSGETAFMEPREVLVHGNRLEELRLDESREVARILLEISRRIFEEEKRLDYTQNVLAWLDFTAARARMAADLGLRAPVLVDDVRIKLRSARHPLLVASARRGTLAHPVVPLDIELGHRFRMLVVTGPNTGGKTVVLKTIGLLQLMLQSGLDLPVGDGSELPILDDVFADIGDEQSLSQNLSTFSGHVRNIARVLDGAGPRALVLLDELGAGTDPAEGAALGQAILEELRGRGGLAVVTTHLGVLKTFGFTRPEVENACVTFDPETFAPTYELSIGQPGNSNALVIAERYGIPKRIVEAARGLVSDEGTATRELVDELMASRVAAEVSRRESDDLVDRSRNRLRQADRALADAREVRRRAEREAEAEVRRVLGEFVEEAQRHLNALRNVPKGLVPHVAELDRLVAERVRATPFAARRREFLQDLKRYDKVFVPRFGQVCRIEKLNRAEERLAIRLGSVTMEIGFDDVSWITPPDAPQP